MKKHNSEEAFYQRIRQLAEVDKSKSKNKTSLGTLINYKKASNGVSYGIVKENHHYYIKKGGIKENPNVSDFTYINGLENITNYQYKSLAEADKQRNLMFNSINESESVKMNPNGGKKLVLNEELADKDYDGDGKLETPEKEYWGSVDKAIKKEKSKETDENVEDSIEQAEDKLDDLEDATAAEEIPADMTEPDVDVVGGDEEDLSDVTADLDVPEPEKSGEEDNVEPKDDEPDKVKDDEEEAPDVDLDINVDDDEKTPDVDLDVNGDDNENEIERMVGKVTNIIRDTELTDSQVKSYVNSFLSAFKNKFGDVEVEDRKEMANKIMKVVPDEESTEIDVEVDEGEKCDECGEFTQYAESRGYTKESIVECGDDEMANLISGYANAHNDGENDGDLDAVALFTNEAIMNSLVNEYGHDEYAEKLKPIVNGLNESGEEDKIAKINELNWRSAGKAVGDVLGGRVKSGVQKAGQAIKGAGKSIKSAVTQKLDSVKNTFSAIGDEISQNYNAREQNAIVAKLEGLARELGEMIAKYNDAAIKAGGEGVKPERIVMSIRNQIKSGSDLSRFKNPSVSENDVAAVEVQPNLSTEFAPEAQNLGVVSESERKIRKYIRTRLEEMTGKRKTTLNESKKSDKLKKFDKLIERQFKLYESKIKKENNLAENVFDKVKSAMGFPQSLLKKQLTTISPNDENAVNKLFYNIFKPEEQQGAIKRILPNATVEEKYAVLEKAASDPDGIGALGIDRNGRLGYRPFKNLTMKSKAHIFGSGQ